MARGASVNRSISVLNARKLSNFQNYGARPTIYEKIKTRDVIVPQSSDIPPYLSHTSDDKLHNRLHNEADNSAYFRSPATSSGVLNYRNLDVYVLGSVENPHARIVRIVHISDTRGADSTLANYIPKGDILIHSGDFCSLPSGTAPNRSFGLLKSKVSSVNRKHSFRQRISSKNPTASSSAENTESSEQTGSNDESWMRKIERLNEFFEKQRHKYKIFVPGCWDSWGSAEKRPSRAEIQNRLTSAIYLEDSSCTILGLKFYGIPWTAADDLRQQDGIIPHSRINNLIRKIRHTSGIKSTFDKISSSSTIESNNESEKSSLNQHTSRFVLPNIEEVAEKFSHMPSDTDICISHSPVWRNELSYHILDRVK